MTKQNYKETNKQITIQLSDQGNLPMLFQLKQPCSPTHRKHTRQLENPIPSQKSDWKSDSLLLTRKAPYTIPQRPSVVISCDVVIFLKVKKEQTNWGAD